MLAEFFAKVLEILLGWINGIIGVLMTPITTAIDEMSVTFPAIAGYKDFMHGCIETFIPYRSIFVCLVILAPVYVANLTMAIILFVKRFIPTLGG